MYNRKEKLIPIFKQYDNDNNGYVTLDEANDILQVSNHVHYTY